MTSKAIACILFTRVRFIVCTQISEAQRTSATDDALVAFCVHASVALHDSTGHTADTLQICVHGDAGSWRHAGCVPLISSIDEVHSEYNLSSINNAIWVDALSSKSILKGTFGASTTFHFVLPQSNMLWKCIEQISHNHHHNLKLYWIWKRKSISNIF